MPVALTQLGDVRTVAKTLVETLNDVLRNLDATRSVESSVVHAGRAQTLAKFCYDRNGHERGEVLLTLEIPCLEGLGAPGASLPSSCALGRQRFQRRRLHWHCFHHQQQQQLHHQQHLPAAYAEQPREPDAQQTAQLHLQATAQLLPMHAAA